MHKRNKRNSAENIDEVYLGILNVVNTSLISKAFKSHLNRLIKTQLFLREL